MGLNELHWIAWTRLFWAKDNVIEKLSDWHTKYYEFMSWNKLSAILSEPHGKFSPLDINMCKHQSKAAFCYVFLWKLKLLSFFAGSSHSHTHTQWLLTIQVAIYARFSNWIKFRCKINWKHPCDGGGYSELTICQYEVQNEHKMIKS